MPKSIAAYGPLYKTRGPERGVKRFPTGIAGLDKALNGGLVPGLTVLGATPSAGKTTLAVQIADNIVCAGHDVLFATLEMDPREIFAKTVSRRTCINSNGKWGISAENLDDDNFLDNMPPEVYQYSVDCAAQAERDLANFFQISPDDTSCGKRGWTVSAIEKYVLDEWIKQNKPAPVVVIDYLQEIPQEDPNMQSFEAISENAARLKLFGKRYEIPVILISSIKRDYYKEELEIASFKGSGDIEYHSDCILALQYAAVHSKNFNYVDERAKTPRKMELLLLKARRGNGSARILLDYYSAYDYFCDTKEDEKENGKSETADRPAQAGKGKSGKTKKDVRSKDEVEKRQLLAALALDEDEAITAAALSEIEAERPDTIINNSGFHTIGALKTNRLLYPLGMKKKFSELAAELSVTHKNFDLVTVKGRNYYVYRYEGNLNGIENALVLLSYPEKAFGKPKALRAFLCMDVSLSTNEILDNYVCRWPIEVFFRQCKDKLALDSYQIRSAQGIRRYWLIMSFAHYMCVVGTGEVCPFETGYHKISDIIQMEKYLTLYQCARECNDFDSFVKVVA